MGIVGRVRSGTQVDRVTAQALTPKLALPTVVEPSAAEVRLRRTVRQRQVLARPAAVL